MTPHELTLAKQALSRLTTTTPKPRRVMRDRRAPGTLPTSVFQVGRKFRVIIYRNGERNGLGTFSTVDEAAAVAAKFAEENPRLGWSESDGDIVRGLAGTMTAKEIGARLGRSRNAVQKFAVRNQISLRP